MKIAHPALAILLAFVCVAANATLYQWRDGSGQMVYSDKPPPPDIRPSQILRRPAGAALPAESKTMAAPASPAAGAKPVPGAVAPAVNSREAAPGNSIVDRDLQFRKRRAERQESEAKAQEASKLAEKTARACEDMRSSLRTLESGARVSRVDEKGVRHYVADVERAQRVGELKRAIAQDCGAG